MTMLILTILTNFLCNNRESVDVGKLSRNIEIVAEALARYVYNVSSHGNLQLFSGGLVSGFYTLLCLNILTSIYQNHNGFEKVIVMALQNDDFFFESTLQDRN